MATKTATKKMTIGEFKAQKKEMEAMILRMIGSYEKPKLHPREMRKKLAKQMGSISASKMIIESR